MDLKELKRECLAAIDYKPGLRGRILDLFYNAEDAAEDGDESFECMLAHDELEAMLDETADTAAITDIDAYLEDADDDDC